MAVRKITKIRGGTVRIKLEDWHEFLRRFRPRLEAESFSGGDCDDFCGAACDSNGGCDLSFGDPGECGALCQDGEVFLQEEV